MGYVAVSGGREAIDASLALQELKRISSGRIIEPELIRSALPDLVEQVEAEGSLWSPGLASIALKQAAGSVEEAVFLVRAYRSTLERLYTTRTVDTRKMRADRRISAAFKDVPGGQLLGATRDYSHRLITFDLESETSSSAQAKRDRILSELSKRAAALVEDGNDAVEPGYLPKVSDYVRSLDLLSTYPVDDTEPVDITKEPLAF
ncbi:MAG: carbon-phosphorus lyase complex subunit PhnI, partial [Coriobacteriales bacterium]